MTGDSGVMETEEKHAWRIQEELLRQQEAQQTDPCAMAEHRSFFFL
jgi:hypothetical protein